MLASLQALYFEWARLLGFFVGRRRIGVFKNYLFCLEEQAVCLFVCFGWLVWVCFIPGCSSGPSGSGVWQGCSDGISHPLSLCLQRILPLLLCVGSVCEGLGRGGYQAEVIINSNYNCESDPLWAGLERPPKPSQFFLFLPGIQLKHPFLWSGCVSILHAIFGVPGAV